MLYDNHLRVGVAVYGILGYNAAVEWAENVSPRPLKPSKNQDKDKANVLMDIQRCRPSELEFDKP